MPSAFGDWGYSAYKYPMSYTVRLPRRATVVAGGFVVKAGLRLSGICLGTQAWKVYA